MSFTENLYLKRQLQQLQEENLKLKKILSEQNENETPAVDRVLRGGKRLEDMTPEEAFQHGQDHSMLQGVSTPAHFFKNPHFAAGFNSTR